MRRVSTGMLDCWCTTSKQSGCVSEEHSLGSRGLHSFTFQLNVSALYGIGGARRGCVARVEGMFRVCRVFYCERQGLS